MLGDRGTLVAGNLLEVDVHWVLKILFDTFFNSITWSHSAIFSSFCTVKANFVGLVIIIQYFLSQLNFIVYLWERKVPSSAETPSPPSSSHLCNRRACWMCQLYEPGLEIKIIGVRILLTRVEISVAKRCRSRKISLRYFSTRTRGDFETYTEFFVAKPKALVAVSAASVAISSPVS